MLRLDCQHEDFSETKDGKHSYLMGQDVSQEGMAVHVLDCRCPPCRRSRGSIYRLKPSETYLYGG